MLSAELAAPPHPGKHGKRCVILVPVSGAVDTGCERGLRELERRGHEVRRVGGYAAIDQARNQMASDALADGFDETMWIDSDIVFDPDDVQRLRVADTPIACGIYPKKLRRELACHLTEGTKSVQFGKDGGMLEVKYAGTGFMLVKRAAYREIESQLKLPVCNSAFGRTMIPYFQPMVVEHDGGHWYLAEDYAFCERARKCGLHIYADTRVRLRHAGRYEYTWEDAGGSPVRYDSYKLNIE